MSTCKKISSEQLLWDSSSEIISLQSISSLKSKIAGFLSVFTLFTCGVLGAVTNAEVCEERFSESTVSSKILNKQIICVNPTV